LSSKRLSATAEELDVSCSPICQPDKVADRLGREVRHSSGGLQALFVECTRNDYGHLKRGDEFHPVNSALLPEPCIMVEIAACLPNDPVAACPSSIPDENFN
jgi:hypothetical protein